MSDIVGTLRGIARMTEDEFLARDPGLAKLFRAKLAASEAMRTRPVGFFGRSAKANARWRTKCEAYERRRAELVVVQTEVDPRRTRRKRDPGRCFRRAGWVEVDRRRGLVILQAPAPEAA